MGATESSRTMKYQEVLKRCKYRPGITSFQLPFKISGFMSPVEKLHSENGRINTWVIHVWCYSWRLAVTGRIVLPSQHFQFGTQDEREKFFYFMVVSPSRSWAIDIFVRGSTSTEWIASLKVCWPRQHRGRGWCRIWSQWQITKITKNIL
jgi:hypothetical protein